jgi:Zn-dependent protease/CBS domain-containing protein
MFTKRWRLFRLLGIPISIDASWLIILALLTWTMSMLIRQAEPDLTVASDWILGLAAALAFFACIVLHELGHAVVARAIDIPIRGITLFLFGGVAEMEGEPPTAGGEFVMAIAGPVVSAVLAVVFWLLSGLEQASWSAFLMRHLAGINLAVLIFNLAPGFPLDGGRVVRSLLWAVMRDLRRATHVASIGGQAFAWLLLAIAFLLLLGGQIIHGLWLGLIGLFIKNAAQGSYQQLIVRQALQGESVSRLMHREPIVVPPNLDLRTWVDDYVYRYHRKMFPVASNGHVEGAISTKALHELPRREWGRHSVGETMATDVRPLSISPETDAWHALEQMQTTGSSRLLVMEADRLVGVISQKDLLRYLNLKLELEGKPA